MYARYALFRMLHVVRTLASERPRTLLISGSSDWPPVERPNEVDGAALDGDTAKAIAVDHVQKIWKRGGRRQQE